MQKLKCTAFKVLLTLLAAIPFAQEGGVAYTGPITIINNGCEPWVGSPDGPTKFSVVHGIDNEKNRGCTGLTWTDPLAKKGGQAVVTVVSKVHHVGGDIQCEYYVRPEGTLQDTVFYAGDTVTCSQGPMSVCICSKAN